MIVATAGHVDHGKTALVKSLTGVDTDRLQQEVDRGLTIEPGFAYRKVNDMRVGFVDVPGHHRFVNNMIAGIGGIDLALLVVAADDGPMPQTLEHLDILRLLGVDQYAVVITKSDRVDPVRVGAVEAQVLALFAATGHSPPVFPVSNATGQGLSEVEHFLRECVTHYQRKSSRGHFRLPIDRAFTLKGKGTVVTGTAVSGSVHIGDSLRLEPGQASVRVRSIHVHNAPAEEAPAGLRCALNIVGNVRTDQVTRGDWLIGNPHLQTTMRADVRFHLIRRHDITVRPMLPVKLYTGAGHVAARLTSLEGRRIGPGDSAFAQLAMEQPVVCCTGDRFLVRDYGEQITLGGGVVLDPYAPRRGKARRERIRYLEAMELGDSWQALQTLLDNSGQAIDYDRFRQAWNLTRDEEADMLARFGPDAIQLLTTDHGRYALTRSRWLELRERVQLVVKEADARHARVSGINMQEVSDCLPDVRPLLLECCLASLVQEGRLIRDANAYRPSERAGVLTGRDRKHWDLIISYIQQSATQVPALADIAEGAGLDEPTVLATLRTAAKQGLAMKITDNRFISKPVFDRLVASAEKLAQEHGPFTVIEFKNLTGIGRNVAVEFLEYLDARGLTTREGNARRFRRL